MAQIKPQSTAKVVKKRRATKFVAVSKPGKGKSYSTKRVLEGKDKMKKLSTTFVEYGDAKKFPNMELAKEWLKKQKEKYITKEVEMSDILGSSIARKAVFVGKTKKAITDAIKRSERNIGIGRVFLGTLFGIATVMAFSSSSKERMKKSPKKAVKKTPSKKK